MNVSNCKPFPDDAQEKTCKHCGGTGSVQWWGTEYAYDSGADDLVPTGVLFEDVCPFCEGTGRAEVQE